MPNREEFRKQLEAEKAKHARYAADPTAPGAKRAARRNGLAMTVVGLLIVGINAFTYSVFGKV
ncbi:MAG: hypothetical protein AAGH15_11320 [Myxococcota bacterium]